MRYLVLFMVLFTLSAGLVEAHTVTYALNSSDVSNFYSGFQRTLETGPNHQPSDWFNPDTGLSGTTVPLQTIRTAYGQVCREFLATVQISGATQQSVGTACRLTNGVWLVQEEKFFERAGTQVRFVIARQQPRVDCSYGGQQLWNQQLQVTTRLQHRGVEQVVPQRPVERFHSRQFHEALQRLQQKGLDTAPQPLQPQSPSKLIKLVAY